MIQNFDTNLFQWLHSWVSVSSFLDFAIVFRAKYLIYVIVFIVLSLGIFSLLPLFRQYLHKNLSLIIFAFVSALTARFIVTEIIRFFYNRPRPFEVLDTVHQLINHAGGGSFPSGHAALSFALATAVSFYYPKTSILFFLAAFSIGLGRVAAGVHWPTDIIGGALVGIVTTLLLHQFVPLFKTDTKNHIS